MLFNLFMLVQPTLVKYNALGKRNSQTFQFWKEYIDMCFILLDFLQAERESNWELHVECLLVPYDRAFDHPKYFQWGLVYLADAVNLEENFLFTSNRSC